MDGVGGFLSLSRLSIKREKTEKNVIISYYTFSVILSQFFHLHEDAVYASERAGLIQPVVPEI